VGDHGNSCSSEPKWNI